MKTIVMFAALAGVYVLGLSQVEAAGHLGRSPGHVQASQVRKCVRWFCLPGRVPPSPFCTCRRWVYPPLR
jgi:hypothetical protein